MEGKYYMDCKITDGVSYPNKFVFNFLQQLGVNFKPEKTFKWSEKMRYDDYLPDHNMIIENHGLQHYEQCTGSIWKLKLGDQQRRDQKKREMALKHNITHYIVLDCRVSSINHIKQSIMNSALPQLLNFNESDIDWNKCGLYASSNLIYEVCDLWNKYNDMQSIQSTLMISRPTVITYLKQGNQIGLCHYDPKEESQMSLNQERLKEFEEKKCKPIAVYNQLGVTHIFKGATYLSANSERWFGQFISRPMIALVCSGKAKSCKGLTFKYISKQEYEQYLEQFGGEVNPNNNIACVASTGLSKPVAVHEEQKIIQVFVSCDEAAEVLSETCSMVFKRERIKSTCLGRQKQYHGLHFKHITKEEYLQYKMIEKNNNIEVVFNKEAII